MEIAKSHVNSDEKFDLSNHMKLLNLCCACMIHEPKYYSSSEKDKTAITAIVNQVATKDPEFILKLALYVRDDLNIRSTANFLLALAANNKACHPYLKKYFASVIRLPSDMLEVVTLYITLDVKYLTGNAIPAILRKVVAKKFPDFDVYQLAKYNKEKAQKRKKKTKFQTTPSANPAKKPSFGVGRVGESAPQGENTKPTMLTLKQVIRKVHLAQPAEPVMCLLGKRYPVDAAAFKKTGLAGDFDPRRAGKRMKLPTPETWETLLSAKGNRHTTWQELIDHKKLPFMAMLRNLRNMIITGISPNHHEIILGRLTDEKTITNSRQLPWRFLSAYQAINIDLEQLMNDILDHDGSGEKIIQVKVKGKKGKQMGQTRTIKKRVIIPEHMPDLPLIARYREAIDTAIRISTMKNIKPIEGSTVVFCDVSGSMQCPCSTKGNMGSIQTVYDIAVLLGLMLQDACEDCDFRIFSSPPHSSKGRCDISVPLEENTILNNIDRVRKYAGTLGGGTDFPYDYILRLIEERKKIDTFIILSDMMVAPGKSEMPSRGHTVTSILDLYRSKVNPNLLFVTIDLYGSGRSLVDINCDEPKNVLITGFSDNILRFIAEKGNRKQLEYVQSIDQIKKIGQPKQGKKGGEMKDEGRGRETKEEVKGGEMEV